MPTTVETVKVVVAGDATGGKKALSETEQAAGSAASKIKAHFSNIWSGLSENEALAPIMGTFNELGGLFSGLSEDAKGLGDKLSNIGMVAAGVGGALVVFGDKDKTAAQQLGQAFTDAGFNIANYKGQVDHTVSSMAKFGYTAPQVDGALQTLVQATRNPKTAFNDMGIAANLAAARHESLGQAATQVAQILAGKGTRTLAQYGITVTAQQKKTKDYTAVLDELSGRIAGQASAASDTFTGHLKALRAEIENHVAEIGQKYGPALAGAGAGMAVIGQSANAAKSVIGLFSKGTEDAATAVEALSGAQEASEGASDAMAAGEVAVEAAGAPIWLIVGAIVLGIAALIAIIYELVTHWKTVFATMKAIVEDCWKFIDNDFIQPIEKIFADVVDFIKQHWQLILAIITGPIGLAALFIKDHFNDIVNFFTQLPSRIMAAIGSLVNIGLKIINDIVAGVASIGWHIWNFFTSIFTNIWNAIGSLVSIGWKIVSDIAGGVGSTGWKIANWFWGVAGAIYNAIGNLDQIGVNIVEDIVSGIESVAGDIGSAVGGILSHIPGAGLLKKVIGFEEGGVVPGPIGAPMLSVVHGGETIIPASILAGGYVPGPALPPSRQTINNGGNQTNINIAAITNASAADIGTEITWQLARLAS
jgi:phage-related protein